MLTYPLSERTASLFMQLPWNSWCKLAMCPKVSLYLTALSKDQPDVCWDPISTFYLHNVPHHQLFCWNLLFLSVSDDKSLLWDRSIKRMSSQPISFMPSLSAALSVHTGKIHPNAESWHMSMHYFRSKLHLCWEWISAQLDLFCSRSACSFFSLISKL